MAMQSECVFIRNGREYDRVRVEDVVYITGDAEYLAFHIRGYAEPLREKCSFAEIKRLLTADFVQIHRSTIINLQHLSKVCRSYVVMDTGEELRVSDGYRRDFHSLLAPLTVGKSQ